MNESESHQFCCFSFISYGMRRKNNLFHTTILCKWPHIWQLRQPSCINVTVVIFLIMLGFAVSQATIVQESGPIFLSYVMCTGNESSLLNCSHPGIGYDYYHHYYYYHYYYHHYYFPHYHHCLFYNYAEVVCASCKSLSYCTRTPRC